MKALLICLRAVFVTFLKHQSFKIERDLASEWDPGSTVKLRRPGAAEFSVTEPAGPITAPPQIQTLLPKECHRDLRPPMGGTTRGNCQPLTNGPFVYVFACACRNTIMH